MSDRKLTVREVLIREIKIPDGATHFSGVFFKNCYTWWKTKDIIHYPYWLYYSEERKEWMIHGEYKPHWLNELTTLEIEYETREEV